jgi:hypothetical protein
MLSIVPIYERLGTSFATPTGLFRRNDPVKLEPDHEKERLIS